MSKHLETVQNIYAAFGRGDLPAILAALGEDIAWEYQPTSTDVPWLQPRNGRNAVAGFFEVLMREVEIKRFEVKHVPTSDNLVVAIVDFEAVVRRTGKTVREIDEAHVWHFDAAGKASKFRHCVDTHAHLVAWQK